MPRTEDRVDQAVGKLRTLLLSVGRVTASETPLHIQIQFADLAHHIRGTDITHAELAEAIGPSHGPELMGMYAALALRNGDEDSLAEVVTNAKLSAVNTSNPQALGLAEALTPEERTTIRLIGAISAAEIGDMRDRALLHGRDPEIVVSCRRLLTQHHTRLHAEPDVAVFGDRDLDVFAAAEDVGLLPRVIEAAGGLDEAEGDPLTDEPTWTDASQAAQDRRAAQALGIRPGDRVPAQDVSDEIPRPSPRIQLPATHDEIAGTDGPDTGVIGGHDAIG